MHVWSSQFVCPLLKTEALWFDLLHSDCLDIAQGQSQTEELRLQPIFDFGRQGGHKEATITHTRTHIKLLNLSQECTNARTHARLHTGLQPP